MLSIENDVRKTIDFDMILKDLYKKLENSVIRGAIHKRCVSNYLDLELNIKTVKSHFE